MNEIQENKTTWTIERRLEDEDRNGGFHIRAGGSESWMNYEVHNLICWPNNKGEPLSFESEDERGSVVGVSDIDKATSYLTGSIKWDGCSHNTFNDNYIHACSRQEMTRLGKLFETLYDIALELMPKNGDYLS